MIRLPLGYYFNAFYSPSGSFQGSFGGRGLDRSKHQTVTSDDSDVFIPMRKLASNSKEYRASRRAQKELMAQVTCMPSEIDQDFFDTGYDDACTYLSSAEGKAKIFTDYFKRFPSEVNDKEEEELLDESSSTYESCYDDDESLNHSTTTTIKGGGCKVDAYLISVLQMPLFICRTTGAAITKTIAPTKGTVFVHVGYLAFRD